jgi:hypothetical protein
MKETTLIQIHKTTAEKLKKRQTFPRETYEEILKRLLNEKKEECETKDFENKTY